MQKDSDGMARDRQARILHRPDQETPRALEDSSFSTEKESNAPGAATGDVKEPERIAMSHTGTAIGLAGSDILAERMNPDVEISDTADPSDIVEVTPENLVNRNAPGSTTLNEKRAYHDGDGRDEPAKVIRRVARGPDTTGT
jgi:hypothetical protein